MNISETAAEAMELIISKTDKNGKVFTGEMMGVLTLCMSKLIETSFCKSHYQYAIDELIRQIQEDLKNDC